METIWVKKVANRLSGNEWVLGDYPMEEGDGGWIMPQIVLSHCKTPVKKARIQVENVLVDEILGMDITRTEDGRIKLNFSWEPGAICNYLQYDRVKLVVEADESNYVFPPDVEVSYTIRPLTFSQASQVLGELQEYWVDCHEYGKNLTGSLLLHDSIHDFRLSCDPGRGVLDVKNYNDGSGMLFFEIHKSETDRSPVTPANVSSRIVRRKIWVRKGGLSFWRKIP